MYVCIDKSWASCRSSLYLNNLAIYLYTIYLYDMWNKEKEGTLYNNLNLISNILFLRNSKNAYSDLLSVAFKEKLEKEVL